MTWEMKIYYILSLFTLILECLASVPASTCLLHFMSANGSELCPEGYLFKLAKKNDWQKYKYFCHQSGMLLAGKTLLMSYVHTYQMCYQGFAGYLQHFTLWLVPVASVMNHFRLLFQLQTLHFGKCWCFQATHIIPKSRKIILFIGGAGKIIFLTLCPLYDLTKYHLDFLK